MCNYCGHEFEQNAQEPSCPACSCKDCDAQPLNRSDDLMSFDEYDSDDRWDI